MTEPALGCYVYCIVPAGSYPALEEAKGVDPDFGLTMVTQRDLSAVASPVRLEQFGADALRRNLEQLPWVERTARAHDSVLARALTADAVIPLRLCTIFTDEAHVREMLERERDLLTSELDRLRGHAEWSVKLLAERAKLEAAARERIPALAGAGAGAGEEGAPGRAFFERKKVDRTVSDEARAIAGAAADEVHTRLREVAAAATLLRPQHPDLSRRPGQMVLNAAYLVHGSHAGEFSAVAEELGRRHRGTGLELDFTGPWAPYNFVTPPEGQRDER